MVLSSAVQALPVDNQPSTPEPVPSWYSALANIPGRQPGTPEIVGGYEVNPKFRYPFIVRYVVALLICAWPSLMGSSASRVFSVWPSKRVERAVKIYLMFTNDF